MVGGKFKMAGGHTTNLARKGKKKTIENREGVTNLAGNFRGKVEEREGEGYRRGNGNSGEVGESKLVVTAPPPSLLQAGCCQYRGQVNRKREPPQHTTQQSI